jgi:hypothetical protein
MHDLGKPNVVEFAHGAEPASDYDDFGVGPDPRYDRKRADGRELVNCDVINCDALLDPDVTSKPADIVDELARAYRHWRNHEVLSGCSHGK